MVTTAYNHLEVARYDVKLGSARKVWKQPFASGVCSPIIYENRVYWAWKGVHCLDFATGKRLWHGGRVGSQGSCILTSDKRLIIWANRGDLMLAETFGRSPKAYRELARVPGLSRVTPGRTWCSRAAACSSRTATASCCACRFPTETPAPSAARPPTAESVPARHPARSSTRHRPAYTPPWPSSRPSRPPAR